MRLPLDFPGLREEAAHVAGEALAVGANGPSGHLLPDMGLSRILARLLADLTRPSSRDFWGRWLAERLGLAVGLTAPSFTFVHTSEDGPAHWRLSGVYAEVCFYTEPVFGVALRSCRPPFVVPNLTLDPAKGPEALATICLHVAGRRT